MYAGTLGRAFQIFFSISAFLAWITLRRVGLIRGDSPAVRLARLLEGLGTSFVKLGQHLSLRSDLFPPEYLEELQKLQDRVKPFPAQAAREAIERAFGKPPEGLFTRFDDEPLAAASVAQVHSARMFDGREVVVKVLRPGVGVQVDRDMRILVTTVRVLSAMSSLLVRYRAEAIVREIAANLRKELDLRNEARNAHRFAEAFRDSPTIAIPDVMPELCSETVMVQERNLGRRVSEVSGGAQGKALAQHVIGAYVEMFFALGSFHGDPHPGNILVRDDGRIAMHDFGIVGSLDRPTRHALAAFMLGFTEQDTEWVLDAWLELGMLSKHADRDKLRPAVATLMADYSSRPIRDWSVGEAFGRLMSATRGFNFDVPLHLIVLVRTIMLLESLVRMLDPEFSLLDSLTSRSREVMDAALGAKQRDTRRLQFEAAVASVEWQRLLASSLQRFREEGVRLRVDHEGLPELSEHIMRGSGRVALALVTLGLYLAGSLLMQFRSGPVIYDVPLLAAIFYVIAAWFTLRLVRSIGRRL